MKNLLVFACFYSPSLSFWTCVFMDISQSSFPNQLWLGENCIKGAEHQRQIISQLSDFSPIRSSPLYIPQLSFHLPPSTKRASQFPLWNKAFENTTIYHLASCSAKKEFPLQQNHPSARLFIFYLETLPEVHLHIHHGLQRKAVLYPRHPHR